MPTFTPAVRSRTGTSETELERSPRERQREKLRCSLSLQAADVNEDYRKVTLTVLEDKLQPVITTTKT